MDQFVNDRYQPLLEQAQLTPEQNRHATLLLIVHDALHSFTYAELNLLAASDPLTLIARVKEAHTGLPKRHDA